MKVLVIGSSGRAHALVKACKKSAKVTSVVCAPGNGGISLDTQCLPVDLTSPHAIVDLAKKQAPDLIIMGPADPQSLGAVDALLEHGFKVFGATKHAAQLESSKTYAKHFLHKYDIPTGSSAEFDNPTDAIACLREESFPTVIKADIMAKGQGVFVVNSLEEGAKRIEEILIQQHYGPCSHILIEEHLKGEEITLMLFVCGQKYVLLPTANDYKRLGDNDTGPNTAGMGAHIPSDLVSDTLKEILIESIIEPTLRGIRQEGIDYRNALYIGIILTPHGPKVLDYKMRFGDPECQALLPLFETDPIEAINACATGILQPESVSFKDNKCSVIILKTLQGYPNAFTPGAVIHMPEAVPENIDILFSNVNRDASNTLTASSGRVLGILAVDQTLHEAAVEAYAFAQKVTFEGEYYRKDIAVRQTERTL